MNRIKRELIIGFWLILIPFLGVPPSLKTVAIVGTGVFILYFVFRTISKARRKQQSLEFKMQNDENLEKNEN